MNILLKIVGAMAHAAVLVFVITDQWLLDTLLGLTFLGVFLVISLLAWHVAGIIQGIDEGRQADRDWFTATKEEHERKYR